MNALTLCQQIRRLRSLLVQRITQKETIAAASATSTKVNHICSLPIPVAALSPSPLSLMCLDVSNIGGRRVVTDVLQRYYVAHDSHGKDGGLSLAPHPSLQQHDPDHHRANQPLATADVIVSFIEEGSSFFDHHVSFPAPAIRSVTSPFCHNKKKEDHHRSHRNHLSPSFSPSHPARCGSSRNNPQPSSEERLHVDLPTEFVDIVVPASKESADLAMVAVLGVLSLSLLPYPGNSPTTLKRGGRRRLPAKGNASTSLLPCCLFDLTVVSDDLRLFESLEERFVLPQWSVSRMSTAIFRSGEKQH